jgi:hypothetical protein
MEESLPQQEKAWVWVALSRNKVCLYPKAQSANGFMKNSFFIEKGVII